MKCPKCQAEMEKVTYEKVEIERCTQCGGLWFDALEKEKLKQFRGSEQVDSGSTTQGREQNKVDKINCPVCETKMVRMVDIRQSHIWYESCPSCHGTFFDAGEFTDYKNESWLDYFRTWLSPDRE